MPGDCEKNTMQTMCTGIFIDNMICLDAPVDWPSGQAVQVILVPQDSEVDLRKPNAELLEAMEDVRLRRNLHGPFKTVDEAMRAMMEE